jgi:hypothetical protein
MKKTFTKDEKNMLIGGTALGIGAGLLGSSAGGSIMGVTGLAVGVSMLNRATKPVRKKKF